MKFFSKIRYIVIGISFLLIGLGIVSVLVSKPDLIVRNIKALFIAPAATAISEVHSLTVGKAITSLKPLTASGGVGPYNYIVSSGILPDGLVLNAKTGEVTGTPKKVYSTANVIFSVRDANHLVASTRSSISFTVNPAPKIAAVTNVKSLAAEPSKNVNTFLPTSGTARTSGVLYKTKKAEALNKHAIAQNVSAHPLLVLNEQHHKKVAMPSKKLIGNKQVTHRKTNAHVTVDMASAIKDTYNNIASEVTGFVHFNENPELPAMANKTEKNISKDNNTPSVQVTTSDAVGTVDAKDVSSTVANNNDMLSSSSSKEQGLTDVTIMSDLALGSVVTHAEDLTINETLIAAVPPVVIYTTE